MIQNLRQNCCFSEFRKGHGSTAMSRRNIFNVQIYQVNFLKKWEFQIYSEIREIMGDYYLKVGGIQMH